MPTIVGKAGGSAGVVPSGGSAGQLLIKNTNTDGDYSWQSPTAAPTQTYLSGYWYCPQLTRYANANAAAYSVAASTCVYVPFYLYSAVTVTALAAYVTTAASGGTLSLGLSSCFSIGVSAGLPSTLRGSVNNISAATVGWKTGTLSTPYTIAAGWSFLSAGALGSSISLRSYAAAAQPAAPFGSGQPATVSTTVAIDTASFSGVPMTSPNTSATAADPIPFLLFQVA